MNLIEYYYILVKYKYLIFLGTVIPTFLLIVYLVVTPPIYEARAKVIVSEDYGPSMMSTFLQIDQLMNGSASYLRKVDPVLTLLEVLRVNPITEAVLKSVDYKDYKGETVESFEYILDKLSLEPIPNTSIVKISFKSKDKKYALRILDSYVKESVIFSTLYNQQELRRAREFLEEQLIVRQKSLDEAEQKLLLFQKQMNTVALTREAELMISRASALDQKRIEVEAQLRAVDSQIKALRSKLENSASATNYFLGQWKIELNTLEGQRTGILSNLESIKQELLVFESELIKIPSKEVAFAYYSRKVNIETVILNNLITSLEAVKLTEAAKIGSIRVVEPVFLYPYPVYPKKKSMLFVGIFGSFLLVFFVAIIINYIRDKVDSVSEVKEISGLACLGIIPHNISQEGRSLVAVADPRSAISEKFRVLRTNIHYSRIGKNFKTLLCTSSTVGEGKSFVASNLGVLYAIAGKKVCLVDCDLRKPSLHEYLGQEHFIGITNYLKDGRDFDKVITKTEIDNLYLLSTGPLPPNPAELIETKNFKEMIEDLKKKFDLLIIDAPPFDAVSDAMILIDMVDEYLFVVDLKKMSRSVLSQMSATLKNYSKKPLGVVINKSKESSRNSYLYNKNNDSSDGKSYWKKIINILMGE